MIKIEKAFILLRLLEQELLNSVHRSHDNPIFVPERSDYTSAEVCQPSESCCCLFLGKNYRTQQQSFYNNNISTQFFLIKSDKGGRRFL